MPTKADVHTLVSSRLNENPANSEESAHCADGGFSSPGRPRAGDGRHAAVRPARDLPAGSLVPASGRKSLFGTKVLVTTAPSRAQTSRSIRTLMSMSVLRATCSRPPAASAPTMSCAIWRLSATADHARLSRGAVQRRPHARSHATSTKMPVIKLARRWGRRRADGVYR